LGLLLFYVQRYHGLGRPWFRRAEFSGQVRHCAPFGLSAGLFNLRGHTDQWVAASLFTLHSFAAFSIASILGQVVNIFRNSVLAACSRSASTARSRCGGSPRSRASRSRACRTGAASAAPPWSPSRAAASPGA